MKRSPLKRTKPLNRVSAKKRNARLRTMKPKRARDERKARVARAMWLMLWGKCWWCGIRWATEVHHISKRSRCGDFDHACNFFAACTACNLGPLDKSDRETQARAMALKKHHDPETFDLAKWCEIHGSNRVCEADIEAAEQQLTSEGIL